MVVDTMAVKDTLGMMTMGTAERVDMIMTMVGVERGKAKVGRAKAKGATMMAMAKARGKEKDTMVGRDMAGMMIGNQKGKAKAKAKARARAKVKVVAVERVKAKDETSQKIKWWLLTNQASRCLLAA